MPGFIRTLCIFIPVHKGLEDMFDHAIFQIFLFQLQFHLQMAMPRSESSYTPRLCSQQFPQGCWRNSINVCLIEHDFPNCPRPLRFHIRLSFGGSTLSCSGRLLHKKFLKTLSSTALQSRRPVVTSALLARLTACNNNNNNNDFISIALFHVKHAQLR